MGGNNKTVETTKKKYGKDHYSRISKMRKSIPGGSFRDKAFAAEMSKKAVEARKKKIEEKLSETAQQDTQSQG